MSVNVHVEPSGASVKNQADVPFFEIPIVIVFFVILSGSRTTLKRRPSLVAVSVCVAVW